MDLWDFKKWRRKLGYTQVEAGEKLGLSRGAVQYWESEIRPVPLAVELACQELLPMLDIYLGVDTGVNTTFGNHLDCFSCGDNNGAAAFHGGFGLNLLDGALTVSATTLIGPENPNVTPVILAGVDPNSALRHLNDVTVIWKATDKLTLRRI